MCLKYQLISNSPGLLTPSPGTFHNTIVALKRIHPTWKYRALHPEIDSKYFQNHTSELVCLVSPVERKCSTARDS